MSDSGSSSFEECRPSQVCGASLWIYNPPPPPPPPPPLTSPQFDQSALDHVHGFHKIEEVLSVRHLVTGFIDARRSALSSEAMSTSGGFGRSHNTTAGSIIRPARSAKLAFTSPQNSAIKARNVWGEWSGWGS